MLIAYRTATGEVVDNTGTNSLFPEGPPDELAYVNTDAQGIPREDLTLLRLHDQDDAGLVAGVLTRGATIQQGRVVLGEPVAASPAQADAGSTSGGPAEGTARLAKVTDDDPLTLDLGNLGTATGPQVRRHAGYTPTVGDTVDASWREGAWLVRDAVVPGTTSTT